MAAYNVDRVSASTSFDKAQLVELHKQDVDHALSPSPSSNASDLSRDKSARASPPLSSLEEIRISELQLGKRHEGRVLYGTLCPAPRKLTAVQTLLEDEAGKVIILSIYNVPLSTTWEALFPEGKRLAIREPCFEFYNDSCVGLRVDNPADIVPLEPAVDSKLEEKAASNVEAVEQMRKQGNNWFAEKEWKKAIDSYTECVDACEPMSGLEAGVCKLLALSNRAAAWLRLDKHENALHDAVKALSMDPGHEKSMLGKARALCGLEFFEEAITCFETLLKQMKAGKAAACPIELKTVNEGLREARVFDKQSRLGEYDPAIFSPRSDESERPYPKCAEYVGPVEVREVRREELAVDWEGEVRRVGRGLFVTRDVQEGELLLVSNALAVAKWDHIHEALGRDQVTQDVVTQVVQVAMASPRKLVQLYSLSDGTNHPQVPAVTLFKPPAGLGDLAQEGQLPEIDVARIRGIVEVNSFEEKTPRQLSGIPPSSGDEGFGLLNGVWVLPSFMNHSCIPNSNFILFGDAMFVKAFRDIPAGSEVTVPYFDITQPVQMRASLLSGKGKRGFVCCCPRCLFEWKRAAQFAQLTMLAKLKLRGNQEGTLDRPHPDDARIVSELEETLQAFEPQHATKKDWVRGSFLSCYSNNPALAARLSKCLFGPCINGDTE